jgi:hypothetical protein
MLVEGQLTPARKLPPLMLCELQVAPAFEVVITRPKSPTATHSDTSGQLNALIPEAVRCCVQVEPPFVV